MVDALADELSESEGRCATAEAAALDAKAELQRVKKRIHKEYIHDPSGEDSLRQFMEANAVAIVAQHGPLSICVWPAGSEWYQIREISASGGESTDQTSQASCSLAPLCCSRLLETALRQNPCSCSTLNGGGSSWSSLPQPQALRTYNIGIPLVYEI